MCLIIASPNGDITSKDVLRHAFRSNPDGWGIMRADGISVQVEKGMSLHSFLNAVDRVAGTPHVIHLRYATHGTVNRANTHPFKIREGLWMAHNGVLNHVNITDSKRSDTYHYAKLITDVLKDSPEFYEDTQFEKILGEDIGQGNKLAFLDSTGIIKIANEDKGFWHEDMWFSNSYSLPDWYGPYARTTEDQELDIEFLAAFDSDEDDELETEYQYLKREYEQSERMNMASLGDDTPFDLEPSYSYNSHNDRKYNRYSRW